MLTSLHAAEFIQYLSWIVFGFIGLQTAFQAIRRPTAVNIDIGLLFGGLALAITIATLTLVGFLTMSRPLQSFVGTALVAMPYLLFRLMDDVVGLPRPLHWLVGLAFVGWITLVWLTPSTLPPLAIVMLLVSLLAVLVYVSVVAIRAALHARGITRRRLTAISLGSVLLACNFGAGRLPAVLPISADDARALVYVLGLAAGVCYLIGFTPPGWLRRAWQEPELRAFLARVATLPQLSDRAAMIAALERGAASSFGVSNASIGLWDEQRNVIRFASGDKLVDIPFSSTLPAAVAFRTQQPLFSPRTRYDAALDQQFQASERARAVLAAPITAGERQLGVFTVAAPRAPIFADDDLLLIQLLADQAAVILESRRLLDEAAAIWAREEAARLKEDFLSAAAHDLKTPLTTIIAQAQLIDRRLERSPERPINRAGIQRIIVESDRLRNMVSELLDAARTDQRRLVGQRESMDVVAAAQAVAQRHQTARHATIVEAPGAIVGSYDPLRITQLLDNLVENAVKYSPDGGHVTLHLWQDMTGVHINVSDHGIGIPPDDLPHLFDRFHRGRNVDDRRFPGMGLGLYICHGIVTEHEGSIAVTSHPGQGSSFHVTLPRAVSSKEDDVSHDTRDR
jgi:signal transduction histidine kinase